MTQNLEKKPKKKNDGQDLMVVIKTTEGDWQATFPKTTKISEVILAVIAHFTFTANGKYKLFLESDTTSALDPSRNLVSYGIEEGSILIFTDLGIAV